MLSTSGVDLWEEAVRRLPQRARHPVVTLFGSGDVLRCGVMKTGTTFEGGVSSGPLDDFGVHYGCFAAFGLEVAPAVYESLVAVTIASGGVVVVVPQTDQNGAPPRHRLLKELAEGVRLAKAIHPLLGLCLTGERSTVDALRVAVVVPNATDNLDRWIFKAEATYDPETAEKDADAVERNVFRMQIRAAIGAPTLISKEGIAAFIKRAVVDSAEGALKPVAAEEACLRLRQVLQALKPLKEALATQQAGQTRLLLRQFVDTQFFTLCKVRVSQGVLTKEMLAEIHADVRMKLGAKIAALQFNGTVDEGVASSLETEIVSNMAEGLDKFNGQIQSLAATKVDIPESFRRPITGFVDANARVDSGERFRRARATLLQAHQHTSRWVLLYQGWVEANVPRQYRFWLSGHGALIVIGITLFVVGSLWTGRGER